MREIQTFVLLPTSFEDSYDGVFNNLNKNETLLNQDRLNGYLSQLREKIEVFMREKNTFCFFSEKNIQAFLSHFSEFKEYINNPTERLYEILYEVNNWEDKPLQSAISLYFLWNLSKYATEPQFINVISEITERMLIDNSKRYLLLNHDALDKVSCVFAFKDFNNDTNIPVFVKIDVVNEIVDCETWLDLNRQTRVFNLNPKHGENGIGAKANKDEKVSLLLCSKEQAQEFLNKAIGDIRLIRELYVFDTNFDKFLVFKDENTGDSVNSYHGFHIDNENEVPKVIRERLK